MKKLSIEYGKHSPAGSNPRAILPTVEYLSTLYCSKFDYYNPVVNKVTHYVGLEFRWWSWFFVVKYKV